MEESFKKQCLEITQITKMEFEGQMFLIFHEQGKSKNSNIMNQGGNSQNFLRQIIKIYVIFRCFYKAIIHIKCAVYVFTIVNINFH